MKKYSLIILLLLFNTINFAQKKVNCDGFQKEPIGKYIVTNESIIDIQGKVVYQPKYGAFNLYKKIISGHLLYEYNKEKQLYRILNLNTKQPVTDFEIKSYVLFDNGYSIIETNKKRDFNNENRNFLFIDTNGKKLCHLPKKSKTILDLSSHSGFKEELAKIQFDSDEFYGQHWGFGFIDKKCNVIIKPKYQNAHSFYEGLAAVLSKNDKGIFKWGFINKKGEKIIDFKFSRQPSSFSEGMAIVENKNGKKGFIDMSGKVIIDPVYDYLTGFYKGIAIAKKDYKSPYKLINNKGETLHAFTNVRRFIYLDKISNHSQRNGFVKNFIKENAAIVFLHKNPKPQVIDLKENILFENKTHTVFNSYKSGLSYTTVRDKTTNLKKVGFVNKKGEFVIIKNQNQF